MPNLWLVIRREYTTRVLRPVFWLTTFLGPLAMALLVIIPILVADISGDQTWQVHIRKDLPFAQKLVAEQVPGQLSYHIWEADADSLRRFVQNNEQTIGMYAMGDTALAQPTVTYYVHGNPGMNTLSSLHDGIRKLYKDSRLMQVGISPQQLDEAQSKVSFNSVRLTKSGEEKGSIAAGMAVGYALALLNYVMLLIYGSSVLMGVLEEKTNRIMEIMVSSVKPLHMMLGKIVGIGAVAFTQIGLWLILGTLVLMGLGVGLAASGTVPTQPNVPAGMEMVDSVEQAEKSIQMINEITSALTFKLLALALFYFLLGYLLYSCLFAAAGSAVDQQSDAQQLTPFIILPILIPMLLLSAVLNDPNGTLAIWMSMIPLFSPIIMIVRMATESVPTWQLLLSMAIMVASTWGMLKLTARIYRVGILMYGKRVTPKELLKWVKVRM